MRAKDLAAVRPPMGWNSWDSFAGSVTEDILLENARYMAAHLKQYGWEYIVCDIQWSEPLAGTEPGVVYRNFATLSLDEYGRQIPAENRFPSSKNGAGFGPVADEIHALGLKFGIHIMRGIPRQAVHEHLPVFGTDHTADEIADPYSICIWNGDMYGVDPSKDGAQAYYDSIVGSYAEWGVDFIKVDDICHKHLYADDPYGADEVEMLRKAIDRCGRPMVLSLSPGPAVIEKAWHMSENANMWRITDDFWDDWKLLYAMFERCEVWQSHVKPGCWPDCDMLPVGRIGIGFGEPRDSRFTKAEQKTMMTLWSIFRSPLIMGGNLPDLDPWTSGLLTNREILKVNQYGQDPVQIKRDAGEAVWMNRMEDSGEINLAFFNLSDEERTVGIELCKLGTSGCSPSEEYRPGECGDVNSDLCKPDKDAHPGTCSGVILSDLWKMGDQAVIRDGLAEVTLPPHGSAMFRVEPADI